MLRQRQQRGYLLFTIFNQRRMPKDDYRSIIHRVMKRRPRKHEPIDDCHRHARIDTTRQRPQRPARRRAVYVKLVLGTRISGWDNERLPFRRKADVTNKSLIENSVDSLAIEMTSFR